MSISPCNPDSTNTDDGDHINHVNKSITDTSRSQSPAQSTTSVSMLCANSINCGEYRVIEGVAGFDAWDSSETETREYSRPIYVREEESGEGNSIESEEKAEDSCGGGDLLDANTCDGNDSAGEEEILVNSSFPIKKEVWEQMWSRAVKTCNVSGGDAVKFKECLEAIRSKDDNPTTTKNEVNYLSNLTGRDYCSSVLI